MVDELYELILGEKGFVVEVRCDSIFDEEKYQRIVELLNVLIGEWRKTDSVPKKAMLAIVELMICLVGKSRFLSEEESNKLEDAGIEINLMLNNLYDTF